MRPTRRIFGIFRQRVVDVKPDELRALGLAFIFNFIVLGSYYVLRPIRDEIGAAGGVENLSWMYTGTLVAVLIANALFSGVVSGRSRRRFIPIAYRFFIANLILFFLLMRMLPAAQQMWVGRAFFVWVSVFNLFVVTVFWAFMTDIFNPEQAKRLFGFISVGGTLGGIMGALLTASLVQGIGAANLLLVSAVLLEGGAWCVRFFPAECSGACVKRRAGDGVGSACDTNAATTAAAGAGIKHGSSVPQNQIAKDANGEAPIGGTIWSGVTHVARSPYLLGICGFMLFHAITGTLVYFQQADITARQFTDRAARTAFFAHLDIWVNVLTIVVQIFLTGRLLRWFGVGLTLAILPLVNVIGFLAVGTMPLLGLLAFFQVLRRAANFAVSRPAREVLFTVLRREDKYKAKSFIDTFVYRGGDQLGAWSYPFLTWLGLGLTGISFVAAPLAAIWCCLSIWLGRRQVRLARAREEPQLRAS
ncbi:MAG: MFS transporter [Chthoniobacterales bacterium]|nr:MFS transporter [Chthoniobacterales bacterium]